MEVRKGKKTYTIASGDYLLFNGAVRMFHPKDNKDLPFNVWHQSTVIVIAKKEFERAIKEYEPRKIEKNGMDYYLFKENLAEKNKKDS